MIFAGGAASLFALHVAEPPDPLAEALGRLLTEHSLRYSQPGPDLIFDIHHQAEDACEELCWSDLPVGVCPPRVMGKVTRYPLACGSVSALVLATDDPDMPVTQLMCTTATPPRSLLIAAGRTIVGHHGFLLNR